VFTPASTRAANSPYIPAPFERRAVAKGARVASQRRMTEEFRRIFSPSLSLKNELRWGREYSFQEMNGRIYPHRTGRGYFDQSEANR
jgi:hypothetical protein